MTHISETGIYEVESLPEFPLTHAYATNKYASGGGHKLRLSKYEQEGVSKIQLITSMIIKSPVDRGFPEEVTTDFSRSVSHLLDHSSPNGGLPSRDISMYAGRYQDLWGARKQLNEAVGLLTNGQELLRSSQSQTAGAVQDVANTIQDLKETIENELSEEEIFLARQRVALVGSVIVRCANSGKNLWIKVNPSETDHSGDLPTLEDFEKEDYKIAKLIGIAPFEIDGKIFANAVVEGKQRKMGQVITDNYNSGRSYLYG